jgi:alpha-D-ribose 1-methylphosphonate 5-triphosphate synthase subunit PhnH
MQTAPLLPGFDDVTIRSQAAFNTIMQAMARPGKIYPAPCPVTAPAPLNPVAAMVALALCDYDTKIWLEDESEATAELNQFLTFHTGAPITAQPEEADFAFIFNSTGLQNLGRFAQGTDAYPDRSTTLIIAVDALTNAAGAVLEGPGIETARTFTAAPLPSAFWSMARANNASYPRGVDMILVSDTALACLPRSTRIIKGA